MINVNKISLYIFIFLPNFFSPFFFIMSTINKTITRNFRKQQQYSNSRKRRRAHYRYFTIYISNYILCFFCLNIYTTFLTFFYVTNCLITFLIFILTILTISYNLYVTNCLICIFNIYTNYINHILHFNVTRSCTFLTFFYITNCSFYIFNIFILTF